MKDKIICLVGPSGSGKTTIAKELEGRYNVIHSYTTRKPRSINEWGHIFASSDIGEEARKQDESLNSNIIGFKEVYPGIYYWAIKEQYQNKGTSIYTVCPYGAKEIQENVKDAEIIIIYLIVDEAHRLSRMKSTRGIEETLNRINDDKKVFRTCKCDYAIDANRKIEEIVKDINAII